MVKVTSQKQLSQIQNNKVKEYIDNLLRQLLLEYKEYCTDGTIDSIGAFYILETYIELNDYKSMGLTEPITKSNFEWIDEFCSEFCNLCVVIDNDKAINIIGTKEMFKIGGIV